MKTVRILIATALLSSSIALAVRLPVTSAFISSNMWRFTPFIERTRGHERSLRTWTNTKTLIGKLGSKVVSSYYNIKPEESKVFLARVFANEPLFRAKVSVLAQSVENIAYINLVLGKLTYQEFKKKDVGRLANLVVQYRHPRWPHMPGKSDSEIIRAMSDEDFYTFAAADLFAVFCLETGILL